MLLAALFVAVQLSASFALRTKRMHTYLTAQLERSFGRQVQVGQFSVQLLPIPRLDMDGVTVGEDPSFGSEYFLRAERMQASLGWMGLLRGHFALGTMSLTRPSLILVRNPGGQWNLEEWLPHPTNKRIPAGAAYSSQQATAGPGNYLQKIEFADGRINFKTGSEKRSFAFTDVTGSVEQTGPGRWQLKLQAKPWRSGVVLQSAGIVYVQGDVAGTSARLQPAQVQVHWDKASLADLFRLVTGNDWGVRGEFGLDGTASVGVTDAGETTPVLGQWKYELQARASQVHRWDLTERNDNPKVSVRLKGVWDLAAREARAEELSVDLPHSNIRGTGQFGTGANASWSATIDSAAVDGQDVLAWYRAFQSDIAEGLALDQFFTGNAFVHGWPVHWEEAQLSSDGGLIHVPGLKDLIHVGALYGSVQDYRLHVEPVRLSLNAAKGETNFTSKNERVVLKPRDLQNWAEFRLEHDLSSRNGSIRVDGHVDRPEIYFKTVLALGQTLNHGWELAGGVSCSMEFAWRHGLFVNNRWNGSLHFTKAEIQAAGLNQPIVLDDARLEWKAGLRNATISAAQAFGAAWSGTANELAAANEADVPRWQFKLHADHLDATDLDRWVGPRARPNWLQRLLPSLLGSSNPGGKPSELLRRISAEGEITADTVSIEKVKLSRAQSRISIQDLKLKMSDIEAQWAGGTVRGSMQAEFSATPKYEILAQIDRANLAQLPWKAGWAERWNGSASGCVRLTTAGVGREDLLNQIAGRGDIQFRNVEFRGWDVAGSLESGAPRAGASRWTSGEGEFTVKDRGLNFESVQLAGPSTKLWLTGSLGFAKEVSLTFRAAPGDANGVSIGADVRVLQLSGPPETPKVAVRSVSTVNPKL